MNYIEKLQFEKYLLCRKQVQLLQDGLEEIQSYLNNSKFQGFENHWVNPDDILMRIQEIKNKLPIIT